MSTNENLKDHILDSIAEGVFTVDKSFKINFFNKAAERITGHNRKDVIGKFCKHIFKSEFCFSECPISVVLQSRKNIYDFESRIKNCVGQEKPIKLNSAVLYNDENEPTGGIISFRDISIFEEIGINFQKQSQFQSMIGHSKSMQNIFSLIQEISDSDAPVFIHGESGTGKELVANAIQRTSNRGDFPYIKFNCSVFPSNLLASELFGHVKGAFTDAIKDRAGRFELADKGTIFLDEVAEMPLQTQIQLLRVLQEGTFERIGESITRHTDVRIIAATNINIKEALRKGIFREDLFYRLNVIPIEVPPLRNRVEDIVPLAKHFVNKFSLIYKKEIFDIEENALDLLMEYAWPGNIRELENAIEYAFVRTPKKNKIDISKLPASLLDIRSAGRKYFSNAIISSNKEKTDMIVLLEKHRWNKTKAAKELGIGRTTLWRRMKELMIVE
jgi:PAS domain S-box-containing protein